MIEQLQACNVSQKVIADSVNTTQANISRIKADQEPKAGLGRAIEDLYLQKCCPTQSARILLYVF